MFKSVAGGTLEEKGAFKFPILWPRCGHRRFKRVTRDKGLGRGAFLHLGRGPVAGPTKASHRLRLGTHRPAAAETGKRLVPSSGAMERPTMTMTPAAAQPGRARSGSPESPTCPCASGPGPGSDRVGGPVSILGG